MTDKDKEGLRRRRVEGAAAAALLDAGVSIPLRTLRLPWKSSGLTLRVTLRRPYLGTQVRIARRWLATGLSAESIGDMDKESMLKLIAEHGKVISRIVADCIWRGKTTGLLFGGVTAWWLRRCVEWKYLLGALTQYCLLSDPQGFSIIISAVVRTSPLPPRLSHTRKGS